MPPDSPASNSAVTGSETSAPPTLLGTYTAPPLAVGAFTRCRFRRSRVRVTSWTDAPIPWPRVQVPKHRGGCGLLVNAELHRAIRTESAAALMHWFGVRVTTAWRWRKWLRVEGHTATPGSDRLQRTTSAKGAVAIKAKEWTDEELDAKSATAKRLGLRPGKRWPEVEWTAAELALLGTASDRAIAVKIGRSRSTVRAKRSEAGIPPVGRAGPV